MPRSVFAIFLIALLAGCGKRAADVRADFERGASVIELPDELHLDRPLVIPKGAKNIQVRGGRAGATIFLDENFKGSAAIEADDVSGLTLLNFTIVGNRSAMKSAWGLPLKEAAFADYYTDNGIVIRNSANVTIRGVILSRIRAFPIILNATAGATVDSVTIEDSGTLNPEGHNNTTGGILIEEGSSNFEVTNSTIRRVAGNAIWTHSYARSPRQNGGKIHDNAIYTVARDAIQVGHATNIRVEKNKGSDIGFPVEFVDFAGYGTPVALDTAGNVDRTVYANNSFTKVAGQCIDLDGFHDGEVTENSCVNAGFGATAWIGLHFGILFGNHDPDMTPSNITITRNLIEGFAYGGMFLIGDHNRIEENRFIHVTLAGCGTTAAIAAKCNAMPEEPDALRSGIYLSDNGGRAADTRANVIRNNVIFGIGDMKQCISAKPGVDLKLNTIEKNSCQQTATQ